MRPRLTAVVSGIGPAESTDLPGFVAPLVNLWTGTDA